MDQLEVAQAEAAEFKARASRASEDLLRATREVGALRDELEKIGALEAKIDQLEAELADVSSQKKALDKALDAANRVAAENAVKVEAAEMVKKGLAAL